MTFILYFVVFQQITAHISEYKQKIVTNKNQPENKIFGKSILLNRNSVMFRPFSCTFMYLMLFMYFFHEVFVNSHALIGNNRNKSYFQRKKLYSKRLFKKMQQELFQKKQLVFKNTRLMVDKNVFITKFSTDFIVIIFSDKNSIGNS